MPQSNVIAAFLLAAFLVFITARGDLPKYGRVFFGDASGAGGSAPGANGGGSAAPGQGAGSAPKSRLSSTLDRVDGVLGAVGAGKLGSVTSGIRAADALGNRFLDFVDGK